MRNAVILSPSFGSAEAAFDGAEVELLRERQPARAVLAGQTRLRRKP